MPIVRVDMFVGRDEETKAIIARQLADVIAEHTNNSLEDVHVIFEERSPDNWSRGLSLASRRDRPAPTEKKRVSFASISRIRFDESKEDEYLALRRDVINPAMATQDGFVSSLLLRLAGDESEYLLINKWVSEDDMRRYEKGPVHEELRRQAMKLLPRPLDTSGATVVHLDR